ncbi:hypothetical protein D4764_04G0010690 [Takifugu flavidus]|uniref:Uncharacterized protein n=1 Tax=Takifugu flavidus TaxID=433684 RepID=A0A5C6N4N0_9TELE|nr:hypothetical protein D4764_04G0010690 [Takifugu flavidus]
MFKRAFTAGDPAELRSVQKELKRSLKESKDAYRKKLEERLERNQIRDVWSGMRTITGFQKKGIRSADGNVDQANELNQFFNRFDSSSPSPSCPNIPLDNNGSPSHLPEPLTPLPTSSPSPLPPADTVWLNTALLSDTDNRQDSPGNEQNRIVGDRQGRDREEGRQGLPGSRQGLNRAGRQTGIRWKVIGTRIMIWQGAGVPPGIKKGAH